MTLNGTGEEWRAMDSGHGPYDGPESQQAVAAARERIPSLRMREAEVRLVDRTGAPVKGLAVEIAQTTSAFLFGDQLWNLDRHYRYGEAETDTVRYFTHRFKDALDAATALCYWTERPRNDGPKTEDFQGDPRVDGFAWCVDWALANGLVPKGHPLFWSIQKCVPEWVMRYDYATRMKFAEVRIRNLVARHKGRVKIWDAVNEPMWEPAFKNLDHRNWPHIEAIADIADYIEPVLTWCREEDPDARFLVNDYGMEMDKNPPRAADGTVVTAALQRRRFLALAEELQRRGTPPDALGLQAHTGGWLDHATQADVYDEIARAGLPLHVTEFWANTRSIDPEGLLSEEERHAKQADYVADYLTVAFGHPALEAFFFWGFINSSVRFSRASSHELTPMYDRVRSLVKEEWRTNCSAVSDADGVLRFHGFFGDYQLRYRFGSGHQQGIPLTLRKEDTGPITLVVPFADLAGPGASS